MSKEKPSTTEKYVPITVCPDCVKDKVQIDPRQMIPNYPVITSTCFTHLVISGEIKLQPTTPTKA